MKYHYSIHGNPTEGWTMDVYKIVPDKFNPVHDTITPYWNKRKEFKLLKDIRDVILEIESEESSVS